MSVFAKLAHYRYALPATFHRDVCMTDFSPITESGWVISIATDECTLYDQNYYKYPGPRRDFSDLQICKDPDARRLWA